MQDKFYYQQYSYKNFYHHGLHFEEWLLHDVKAFEKHFNDNAVLKETLEVQCDKVKKQFFSKLKKYNLESLLLVKLLN
jgi:hypothetical protein